MGPSSAQPPPPPSPWPGGSSLTAAHLTAAALHVDLSHCCQTLAVNERSHFAVHRSGAKSIQSTYDVLLAGQANCHNFLEKNAHVKLIFSVCAPSDFHTCFFHTQQI